MDGVSELLLLLTAKQGEAVLELNCHGGVRDSVDLGGEVCRLVQITPLAGILAAVAMNEDDRVAPAEGVVYTSLEATFVLRQSYARRDAITGVEVARDTDDVRGRCLRRRDDESRHEQEKRHECRKYAYAPSIHRSHSLSERVSFLVSINAEYIVICIVRCVKIVLSLKHKYNSLYD